MNLGLGVGLGGGPLPLILPKWDRPLYPNFPITSTIRDGITIADIDNITGTDSNAILTDTIGPDWRNGVAVQIGSGTSRGLYFAIPGGPINLTDCNIEIDYCGSNLGSFVSTSNSDFNISVYSSGTPTSPDNSNRNFVSVARKIWQLNSGMNVATVAVPASRITGVFGTGADMTAVSYIGLTFKGTASARPTVVLLGIRIRPNLWADRGNKIPVFMRFDGGYAASHYDYAFQQMKTKFGGEAKMFCDISMSWLDNPTSNPNIMTYAQLREIVLAGGEGAPHGGYGTDNAQDSQAAYRPLFEAQRIRAKEMSGDDAPLIPNLDHTSSFFTWYSDTSSKDVFAKAAILQNPTLARCAQSYLTGIGNANPNGTSPLVMGGPCWPPEDRWSWYSVSTNSWSSTPTAQNPAPDVTSFVDALFADAKANRSYVSLTTHSELASAGDGRVAFDRALDNILADPTFYLTTPNAELDRWVAEYGGIT